MFRNKLLSRLQPRDIEALRPLLERVEIKAGDTIERPNQPVAHAYFPEDGIASVIATDLHKRRIETGPFGRDGMSGLPIILNTDSSPNETLVQIPGSAHRVPAEALRHFLAKHPSVQSLFLRYVHVFGVQTAHTLLAAGLVVVETRLARWILMLHDRIDGDDIAITHDFMALMLSVRRPGVTVALHMLEGKGLIRSVRGRLTVRDRPGLEKMCGTLYGQPETEYRRVIEGA